MMLAEGSFWNLVVTSIKASSAIENGILLILVICSIISWAIVLWKYKTLRGAMAGSAKFVEQYEAIQNKRDLADRVASLGVSPHALIYTAAFTAADKVDGEVPAVTPARREGRLTIEMQHATRVEFSRMHRGMDILASIASATPFIGLLGTVLGIISTFQMLGQAKSASLNVVAPGIAAALIATAAGLLVAIPAVFSYNWLMARMDEQQEEAEMFIEQMAQSLHHFDTAGASNHSHLVDRSEPSYVSVNS